MTVFLLNFSFRTVFYGETCTESSMSRKGSSASVSAKSVKSKHNETGKDPITAEIKAAYIAVLNHIDKDISSKDELEKGMTALDGL